MNSQSCDYYAEVKSSFDASFETYMKKAILQRQIGQDLASFFDLYYSKENLEAKHVLDLGAGSGFFYMDLAKKLRPEHIDFVDLSFGMLKNINIEPEQSFRIHEMNFDEPWSFGDLFDLIHASMSLHWSLDLGNLLRQARAHLKKDGIMLFSLPLTNSLRAFKELGFACHEFYQTEDVEMLIRKAGFLGPIYHESKRYSMSFEWLIDALRYLKQTGVSTLKAKRSKILYLNKAFYTQPINLVYEVGLWGVKR